MTEKSKILISCSQTDKIIIVNRSLKLPSIQICVAYVAGKYLQKKKNKTTHSYSSKHLSDEGTANQGTRDLAGPVSGKPVASKWQMQLDINDSV